MDSKTVTDFGISSTNFHGHGPTYLPLSSYIGESKTASNTLMISFKSLYYLFFFSSFFMLHPLKKRKPQNFTFGSDDGNPPQFGNVSKMSYLG